MTQLPPKLSGTSELVPWLNRLRDAVAEAVLTSVVNGRFNRGPGGTQLICGGVSSGAVGFGVFLLKSVRANDLVCHTWDGTNEGADDIEIAKCQELTNPSSEVIDSVTVNYTSYPSTCDARVASDGSYSENQVITPRFIPDETIIYAAKMKIEVAGVGSWDWLDMNAAGRAWTRTQ